ncbi:CvpA family protein [Hydrogenimonas urashimensis]|uniref:CvpA family protein n=1 Tax=Hydrogenimonas urashimensis TaxID=2740515 RepID=UPI0019154282|nr:CvpA family protein [Hydrogenimonas urashimensis]
MNWFDIVAAALIVLIGVKGIFNGLVRELSGLAGLIAGIWLASLYADGVGRWLGTHLLPIDSVSALDFIGFLAILTITWLFFIVMGVAVTKFLSIGDSGVVDRLFGFLFASAKVFIILGVIVFALSRIDFVRKNSGDFLKRSRLYPYFVKTGEAIVHMEPEGRVKNSEILKDEAENFIKKDTIQTEKKDKQSKKGSQ